MPCGCVRPRLAPREPARGVLTAVATPLRVPARAGCPACGRPPPQLLLSRVVAEWLQEVCGADLGAAPFTPYRDEASGKVWASLELSDALQSGTVRGAHAARALARRARPARALRSLA